jgi:uncharacterized phage protein (TIGR01671 family)
MREIMFRAWDTKNGQDQEELDWNDNIPEMLDWSWHRDSTFNFFNEPYRFKVMQFTGLQDKDGKYVYEGDIIRVEGGTLFKVYYSDTSACYRVERIRDGWHFDLKELFPIGCWEVVGNIYETPELLTK